MIKGNQRAIFAKAFGIEGLDIATSKVLGVNESIIGNIHIKYIWIAHVDSVWNKTTILGITSCKWYLGERDVLLGLLLVRDKSKELGFLGKEPIRCVKLPNKNDVVLPALQSMNLIETVSEMLSGDIMSPAVDVDIITRTGDRNISYLGANMHEASWKKLLLSLINCAQQLNGIYQDAELSEFFTNYPISPYVMENLKSL
jgi:hypothetical protein